MSDKKYGCFWMILIPYITALVAEQFYWETRWIQNITLFCFAIYTCVGAYFSYRAAWDQRIEDIAYHEDNNTGKIIKPFWRYWIAWFWYFLLWTERENDDLQG